jgi:hypothetical protein
MSIVSSSNLSDPYECPSAQYGYHHNLVIYEWGRRSNLLALENLKSMHVDSDLSDDLYLLQGDLELKHRRIERLIHKTIEGELGIFRGDCDSLMFKEAQKAALCSCTIRCSYSKKSSLCDLDYHTELVRLYIRKLSYNVEIPDEEIRKVVRKGLGNEEIRSMDICASEMFKALSCGCCPLNYVGVSAAVKRQTMVFLIYDAPPSYRGVPSCDMLTWADKNPYAFKVSVWLKEVNLAFDLPTEAGLFIPPGDFGKWNYGNYLRTCFFKDGNPRERYVKGAAGYGMDSAFFSWMDNLRLNYPRVGIKDFYYRLDLERRIGLSAQNDTNADSKAIKKTICFLMQVFNRLFVRYCDSINDAMTGAYHPPRFSRELIISERKEYWTKPLVLIRQMIELLLQSLSFIKTKDIEELEKIQKQLFKAEQDFRELNPSRAAFIFDGVPKEKLPSPRDLDIGDDEFIDIFKAPPISEEDPPEGYSDASAIGVGIGSFLAGILFAPVTGGASLIIGSSVSAGSFVLAAGAHRHASSDEFLGDVFSGATIPFVLGSIINSAKKERSSSASSSRPILPTPHSATTKLSVTPEKKDKIKPSGEAGKKLVVSSASVNVESSLIEDHSKAGFMKDEEQLAIITKGIDKIWKEKSSSLPNPFPIHDGKITDSMATIQKESTLRSISDILKEDKPQTIRIMDPSNEARIYTCDFSIPIRVIKSESKTGASLRQLHSPTYTRISFCEESESKCKAIFLPKRIEENIQKLLTEYPKANWNCEAFVKAAHGDFSMADLDSYRQLPYFDEAVWTKISDTEVLKPGDVLYLSSSVNKKKYHFALYMGDDLYLSKFGWGNTPVCIATEGGMLDFYEAQSRAILNNRVIYRKKESSPSVESSLLFIEKESSVSSGFLEKVSRSVQKAVIKKVLPKEVKTIMKVHDVVKIIDEKGVVKGGACIVGKKTGAKAGTFAGAAVGAALSRIVPPLTPVAIPVSAGIGGIIGGIYGAEISEEIVDVVEEKLEDIQKATNKLEPSKVIGLVPLGWPH